MAIQELYSSWPGAIQELSSPYLYSQAEVYSSVQSYIAPCRTMYLWHIAEKVMAVQPENSGYIDRSIDESFTMVIYVGGWMDLIAKVRAITRIVSLQPHIPGYIANFLWFHSLTFLASQLRNSGYIARFSWLHGQNFLSFMSLIYSSAYSYSQSSVFIAFETNKNLQKLKNPHQPLTS